MARKAKKDENYLDYIPAVSTKNSWDADAEGNVTIHMVHRGFYAWIAQKVFHRPRVSHIDLDEMGSFIFPLIDGERTVGQIAQLVRERFGRGRGAAVRAAGEVYADPAQQRLHLLRRKGQGAAMTVGQIMLGIALFAIAGAVLYVWGLKKSVNQREDLQRSLLSACGSRVVRRAKKQGGITRAEIAALIEGLSVGPFWSRSRVRVQSGEKAADQVIAFLLGQQYLEAAGDDTYRVKK